VNYNPQIYSHNLMLSFLLMAFEDLLGGDREINSKVGKEFITMCLMVTEIKEGTIKMMMTFSQKYLLKPISLIDLLV